MNDMAQWELLCGKAPLIHLDTDPTGRYQAWQVCIWTEVTVERAAIWDAETGKTAWVEDGVIAICWVPTGDQILVVRELYRPDLASRLAPSGLVIVTPLQSEFSYYFERRAWPSFELLATAPLVLPTGWPVEVRCSPCGGLAGIAWRDQCESGFEVFDWDSHTCQQRNNAGYFAHSNLNSLMAFSSDGRFVVVAYGLGCWWSEDGEAPSRSGKIKVGWVAIGDVEQGRYVEADLIVSVPEGWTPEDPEDMVRLEVPSTPLFMNDTSFELQLPKGCKHVMTVAGEVKVAPSLAPDS